MPKMYRARAHTFNRTSEIPHDTQFQQLIANDCSMNRSKKLLPSPAYLQYGSLYSDPNDEAIIVFLRSRVKHCDRNQYL